MEKRKKTIIEAIFGRRYWANIINTRGTDKCEISCFIFRTREEAREHQYGLSGNRSFMYIETVSFRSRKDY